MPLQPAQVIAIASAQPDAVTNDSATDQVTVRTLSGGSCAACAAGHGCGAGLFSRLLLPASQDFVLQTDLPLLPGDRVLLQAEQRDVEHMVMIWYGLPLLLMLLSAALTQTVLTLAQWQTRPWMDLTVLLALLAGLATGWWLAGKWSAQSAAKVNILRHCTEHGGAVSQVTAIEEPSADTNIAHKMNITHRLQ